MPCRGDATITAVGSSGSSPSASGGERPRFDDYYRSQANTVLFRWIDRAKVRVIRRALAPLGPGATVLDLGAGGGAIPASLSRCGVEGVMCLDHDVSLLELCRRRGLAVAAVDLEHRLPVVDHGVDGVVMVDVIEHMEHPRTVVAEIRRVIRPGGVGVIFTPPYDSIRWLLAERAFRAMTGRDLDHISPFTAESFRHLVQQHFTAARFGRTNCNLSMYAVVRG